VYPDSCTGCEACVDVCPADCLELVPGEDGAHYAVAQMANAKACTACKECEQICSDKRAIVVEWPDGAYCEFLGEVPENWVAARKGAMASVR
jgi:electron transport complex protein RnfB